MSLTNLIKQCVLVFALLFGLVPVSVLTADAQDVMNWRLTNIYWKQSEPNSYVRIIQNQADSRGGSIDIEHFPTDRGCREPAIKASYRWRFSKDISFLSGKRGELAFVSYPESKADTGKGCWNPNSSLFWGPGSTNDFAWTKCINDQGECRYYLQGNQINAVEVYFNSYVRDGYKGQFIVNIRAHGVSGGWTRQVIYEFEQAAGKPADNKTTFCDQYARSAGGENDENTRRGCGYRGDRWHNNYQAHFNWCLSVDQMAAESERRIRNEELRKCKGASVFTNPTRGAYRVDRCLYWGEQCDQPAADRFCREKGFSGASSWKWEYVAPTVILGSGQVCNGDRCGGFSLIECYEARK